jgi:hypothetical protein
MSQFREFIAFSKSLDKVLPTMSKDILENMLISRDFNHLSLRQPFLNQIKSIFQNTTGGNKTTCTHAVIIVQNTVISVILLNLIYASKHPIWAVVLLLTLLGL